MQAVDPARKTMSFARFIQDGPLSPYPQTNRLNKYHIHNKPYPTKNPSIELTRVTTIHSLSDPFIVVLCVSEMTGGIVCCLPPFAPWPAISWIRPGISTSQDAYSCHAIRYPSLDVTIYPEGCAALCQDVQVQPPSFSAFVVIHSPVQFCRCPAIPRIPFTPTLVKMT